MGKNPNISYKYDNNLLVDGQHLQVNVFPAVEKFHIVQPDELNTILSLGHDAIRDQIEMIYERMSARNSDVVRPSMWTALLAPDSYERSAVITPRATDEIITRALDVQSTFRPYWHAIEDAGFEPEIRRGNGRWLLARLPEEAHNE